MQRFANGRIHRPGVAADGCTSYRLASAIPSMSAGAAYFDVPATAGLLGTNAPMVRKLIRDGKLSAFRVGKGYRIDPDDLNAFIARAKADAVYKGSTEAAGQ